MPPVANVEEIDRNDLEIQATTNIAHIFGRHAHQSPSFIHALKLQSSATIFQHLAASGVRVFL